MNRKKIDICDADRDTDLRAGFNSLWRCAGKRFRDRRRLRYSAMRGRLEVQARRIR